MILDIVYAVGDNVNYIKHTGMLHSEVCGFCAGSGTIEGHDGRIITCPICDGKGNIETDNRSKVSKEGIVTDICVSWHRNEDGSAKDIYVDYEIDGEDWVSSVDVLSRIVVHEKES